MCSNRNITWEITSNSVKDRMIDNSLLHTFVSSRKIRKRTKIVNAELEKCCGVKDYKDYIDLKTKILRNLKEDYDTDDAGYLTDIDYNIIYNSESTQAKYIAERRTKKYSFTNDLDYETYRSKNNTKNIKHKKQNKSKNTKKNKSKNIEVQNKDKIQRNKSLRTKHNTSNKHINIGWQEVVRQRDISHSYDNRTTTNISNDEKNTSEDEECNFLTQVHNQSYSQQLAFRSNTLSNTIKSKNRKTKKSNRDSNVIINKLHSENSATCISAPDETEVTSKNNLQNYERQNTVLNDSHSELDSQSSHYDATPSKPIENINDFNNELNPITLNFEDGIISSKIEIFDENKEQIYKDQDAAFNKSNAELELQSPHCKVTLSESTENINNLNNELNPITLNFEDGIISSKIEVFDENKEQIHGHQDAAFNRSNAELESQSSHKATLSKSTENINDFNNKLNPIILKENNNAKLTEANNGTLINRDNCNSYMNYKSKLLKNVRRNLTSVLEEVNFTNNDKHINTDKNIKNGLDHDQLHLSVNSSRHSTPLQKKRINVQKMYNSSLDISLLDQQKDSGFDDDSQDKFVKMEKSNVKSPPNQNIAEKILVSPEHSKKDANVKMLDDTIDLKDSKEDINNMHLKISDDCLEQNNKKVTKSSKEEKIKNSSPNKDVELSAINQEDKTHFVKVEKLCNVQKPSLSPKQDHIKNAEDSKSYSHILEKQDNEMIKNEKEKIKNLQLNQDDKDAEISINQEDKTHFGEKEDLHNTQKQQLLSPKQDLKQDLKDRHSKFDNIAEEQSNKEIKELLDEEEVKNLSQLNQVHKDTEILIEDKMHIEKSESDIQKQSLLSPKKECIKNEHSKSYNNILDERDNKEVKESPGKEVKNFHQLGQIDEDIKIFSLNEDKTNIKLKDLYNTQKLQLPKITCTEIINIKYKIINKKINDINSDIEEVDNINDTNEHTPVKTNTLINCSNVNWQDEVTDIKEDNNVSMIVETDNEEENTYYMSPRTQKRLQQQAKLNLVVNSESSSESDNEAEYVIETSRKSINNSDANCSENDNLNDETNYTCEKIDTNISSSEDICMRSRKTSVSKKDMTKQNVMNMKEEIKDKAVLSTKGTYENSSLKSTVSKSPLKETGGSENVNNNDGERNEHVEDIERSSLIFPPSSPKFSNNSLSEFSPRISENNVSCNGDNSNQFLRDDQSSSLNVCNKRNQWEYSVCTDTLETSCNSGLDISYKRPYNLQQLIEDQQLLVETLPASFTLADISDDDEAFILNIPNKVLEYNLQDQLLTIKGDTIKFGKNKYKIVRKKVGTTSCVFATGRKRKPYKIVNINEISTVTVRERLPPDMEKSDILTSYSNVISTKSKSRKINNRQTDKKDLNILEVSDHKRKRYISDFEINPQSVIKRKRLKVKNS